MCDKISKAATDEGLLSKLDEFTDEEIGQLCNYSRALHTTTDFDEEVERELKKLEAEKQCPSNSDVSVIGQNPIECFWAGTRQEKRIL
jgi:predicted phage-related endonuclease